jgi:hypothetical protein
MSCASCSVNPSWGIGVPGLRDCGSIIQRVIISGEFGIDSPTSVGRSAVLLRRGPMTPFAPSTPRTVWQPPHPLDMINARPCSGSPGTPGPAVSAAAAVFSLGGTGVGGVAGDGWHATTRSTLVTAAHFSLHRDETDTCNHLTRGSRRPAKSWRVSREGGTASPASPGTVALGGHHLGRSSVRRHTK